MRLALLICDKCHAREEVSAGFGGKPAEGWRMIMGADASIAADLCPACDAEFMGDFMSPADNPAS